MIERPSPNHGPRAPGKSIDMLVLHYTGMIDAAAALARLCDPEAKVSAHYAIDEDGTVYRLVPEERRAWHAGVASWAGETDINSLSIGIELVNPGHEFGYRPFPEAQMAALIELAKDIVKRHRIHPARVLGHSDVAPLRKLDPGELFDWARLAQEGVGIWPGPGAAAITDIAEAQRTLSDFGYGIDVTGVADEQTTAVISAFQRHFRQPRIDGELDAETGAILAGLPATPLTRR